MDRGYSPWGHKELDMTEQLILSPIKNEKIPGAIEVS